MRRIRYRWATTCTGCAADLPAGSRGWWDGSTKSAHCDDCVTGVEQPHATEARGATFGSAALPPPDPETRIDRAGASAQAEYERRRRRRQGRVHERYPRAGGLLLAWAGEPQHERAWQQGADGERMVGERLAALEQEFGVLSLNDRRVPRSRANIDHIAVTASGVWVIDAKHWKGDVELRDVSGLFAPSDRRLYVGRRDRTTQIGKLDGQVEVVQWVLDSTLQRWVPVHAALALTIALFPWRRRPYEFGPHRVGNLRMIIELLRADGPVPVEQRRAIHAALDRALPPAA